MPPFEEKEEEEEESGEDALPICRDGSRHSGPMFTVSTFFAERFEVRRSSQKSETSNSSQGEK